MNTTLLRKLWTDTKKVYKHIFPSLLFFLLSIVLILKILSTSHVTNKGLCIFAIYMICPQTSMGLDDESRSRLDMSGYKPNINCGGIELNV